VSSGKATKFSGMRGRAGFLLLIAASQLTVAGTSVGSASAEAPLPNGAAAWQKAMAHLRLPGEGCFSGAYPEVEWVKVACKPAPRYSQSPASSARAGQPQVVGADNGTGNGGTDYLTAVPAGAPISAAIGLFGSTSVITGESGQLDGFGSYPNTFSLQLNSQYNLVLPSSPTSACAGASFRPNCKGWEQFIYDTNTNTVYIEYWLLHYMKACTGAPPVSGAPPGWVQQNGSDCTIKTYGGPLTLPHALAPPLTGAELSKVQLEGTAGAGGDAVVLTVGTNPPESAAYSGPDILDLSSQWKSVEFGVYGDAGGGEAVFDPGTNLVVQTVVNNGASVPPECAFGGPTGEWSNLFLSAYPLIERTPLGSALTWIESYTQPANTPACATQPPPPAISMVYPPYGATSGHEQVTAYGSGLDPAAIAPYSLSVGFASSTGGGAPASASVAGCGPLANANPPTVTDECTLTTPLSPNQGHGPGYANVTPSISSPSGSLPGASCGNCYDYLTPNTPVLSYAPGCGGLGALEADVINSAGTPAPRVPIKFSFSTSSGAPAGNPVIVRTDSGGAAFAVPPGRGILSVRATDQASGKAASQVIHVIEIPCSTIISDTSFPGGGGVPVVRYPGGIRPEPPGCTLNCPFSVSDTIWDKSVIAGGDPAILMLGNEDPALAAAHAAVSVDTTSAARTLLETKSRVQVAGQAEAATEPGAVFVGPVIDITGPGSLFGGTGQGDPNPLFRLSLPYNTRQLPDGATVEIVRLSGSTWVSSGIRMIDAVSGVASAELPGAGLYTVVAVTNAGSDR
jgi:hypothetical protein